MASAEVPVSFSKWPPDASRLAGIGLDSVSFSKEGLRLLEVRSTSLSGAPHLFTEITFSKNSARLSYSLPPDSDHEACGMRATLLFMRVLRLLPGVSADAQELSKIVLPSLEAAGRIASEPYAVLRKEHRDMAALLDEEREKSRRLLKSSEDSAARCLGLEQRLAAAQEKLRKLEAIPDGALCELVLDWVATHQGTFDCAQFSRASGLPPARCEQGLEILLKKGALRRIGPHFSLGSSRLEPRQFELERGWEASAARVARGLANSIRGFFSGKGK